MKTNLNESSIPQNYSQAAFTRSQHPLKIDSIHVYKIYEIMIHAISDFLAAQLNEFDKVAISLEGDKGFNLAALVTKHKEDDAETGNNSYVFTTNPADLEGAKVFKLNEPAFIQMASAVAHSKHAMVMSQLFYLEIMFSTAAYLLLDWLDTNASENEVVEIELPGYFLAKVAVENGEKMFEVLPIGEMKTKIKTDEQHQA